MRKFAMGLAALLLVSACATAFAGPGASNKPVGNLGNPRVLPPQSVPYGKTYGEWSAVWWQWAFGLPSNQNPFYDGSTPETYGQCVNGANGQSGPVWFLTGVINTSGTAVRSCTVPAGKALFFPVLNNECSTIEAPPYHADPAELASCAQSFVLGSLWAVIDGVAVENVGNYLVASPVFSFTLPENNVLGLPAQTGLSASYGAWLMLAPLSVGTHVLHFGGTYPELNFSLDITYTLTVQ